MTKLTIRTPNGDTASNNSIDELVVTLPNGSEISITSGDPANSEIILMASCTSGETPARFVVRPGAANQISLSLERD